MDPRCRLAQIPRFAKLARHALARMIKIKKVCADGKARTLLSSKKIRFVFSAVPAAKPQPGWKESSLEWEGNTCAISMERFGGHGRDTVAPLARG